MRKFLPLLILFFFGYVFAPAMPPETYAVLENESLSIYNNYIHNEPKAELVIKNTGNRTAEILNIVIGGGGVVEYYPGYISPDYKEKIYIKFLEEGCNDYNKNRDFNISILYEKSEGNNEWLNVSGQYNVKNPLELEMNYSTRSLLVGQMDEFYVFVKNNGEEQISYNLSISNMPFYTIIERKGGEYGINELDNLTFYVKGTDPLKIKIIANELAQGEPVFRITDKECGLYKEGSFFIKSLTQGGFITPSTISPDIDCPALLVLSLLSSMFLLKLLK